MQKQLNKQHKSTKVKRQKKGKRREESVTMSCNMKLFFSMAIHNFHGNMIAALWGCICVLGLQSLPDSLFLNQKGTKSQNLR